MLTVISAKTLLHPKEIIHSVFLSILTRMTLTLAIMLPRMMVQTKQIVTFCQKKISSLFINDLVWSTVIVLKQQNRNNIQ
jgi:hypothetical protein